MSKDFDQDEKNLKNNKNFWYHKGNNYWQVKKDKNRIVNRLMMES